jgi:hypothetical protein
MSEIRGEGVMAKTKEIPWEKKPLMEKVSAILYPALTTDENRKQMQAISRANGKRSPQEVAAELRGKR